MAKMPLPPKRVAPAKAGSTAMGMAPVPAQEREGYGKIDLFAMFGLAVPAVVLGLIGLFNAMTYTSTHLDKGGLGSKLVTEYNSNGPGGLNKTDPVKIIGFESHNYIGRLAEGEVDVVLINAGRMNNVRLGDVFVPGNLSSPDTVRLEFVVFQTLEDSCRAYVLMGQDVKEGARAFTLKQADLEELCGTDLGLKREWKDQVIRRYVETRSKE